MPIIHINLVTGRSLAMKDEMARRVTEVVAESLQADPATIRVLLHEVTPAGWYAGGTSLANRAQKK